MKFTFITIAVLVIVFWCAQVDGDQSDFYAGIADDSPFSKQDEDYSPLFPESSYTLPRMRGSFPWTRDRKPTKSASQQPGGDTMTETMLRELEEILERRRQQIKVDAVKNFQYLNPHQSILDDPRPYAYDGQDDDQDVNVDLPIDDVVSDNSDVYLSMYARPNQWQHLNPEQTSHEAHATHKMHELNQQETIIPASAGYFKDIEFVKDPADFAYPPTDPRYFEDITKHETIEETLAKMGNVNVKTLTGKSSKLNKFDYGTTWTRPDANAEPANSNFNNDDYKFLTDDNEQMSSENNQQELVNSLLNDAEINIKHRNDLGSGGQNEKDYLRNNEDLEVVAVRTDHGDGDSTGIYILAIIAGVSAAALVTLITLVITWFNLQKHVKNASDAEYPAYGVTGPNKEVSPSGDRRLAQSAQMYHYQHQKQQIIAMERAAATERHGSISEADSDEENEEGDYTVYECPGLAPTGEMEVKNPMFQDDPTPAQTPQQKQNAGEAGKQ